MGPDTMAQRTDLGKENEQDGVKGLEQLYLEERIIFTRRGWPQAVCIGSSLEGPWQARQDACRGLGVKNEWCGAGVRGQPCSGVQFPQAAALDGSRSQCIRLMEGFVCLFGTFPSSLEENIYMKVWTEAARG